MIRSATRIGMSTLVSSLCFLSACSSEDAGPSDEVSALDPTGTATGPVTGGSPSAPAPVNTSPGTSEPVNPVVPTGTSGNGDGMGGALNGGGASNMAGGSSGMGSAVPTMPPGMGGEANGGASGASDQPQPVGGAGGEVGTAGSGATGGVGISGSGGLSGDAGGGGTGSEVSPLPPVDDYSDFGPYDTTTEANTGPDGTYTIVRPETLGEDGFLHAPITFGPGTGMQVSQMSGLLERIASHGFVIIGRQLEGAPGDPVTRMRMTDGLDWIIEQNSTGGSEFEGMIDVDNAVAMGYSVGGTGAVEIGGHEAITTVVSIHGHGAEGDLHGPLLLIGGTEDTMPDGLSWLAPTYDASQVQTVFALLEGADHGYIQGSVDGVQGGLETPVIIAWIRYWVYNDQGASDYFFGDDCVLCSSPWSDLQSKDGP